MSRHDRDYLERRVQQEQARAAATDDAAARRVHLALAEQYRARIGDAGQPA